MATYVIGDIQGCFDSLQLLLAKVAFHPVRDRLWLVGDLVNRGPKSLDVLRWASRLGPVVTSVLGNHDLHLLARFHGVGKVKKRDTLDEVLAAKDAAALMSWLIARPFIHRTAEWVMVHGGLLPGWTLDEAQTWASRAHTLLQTKSVQFFATVKQHPKTSWEEARTEEERLATAVAALTRIRMCTLEGAMVTDFDGPLEDAPQGTVPWFDSWRPALPRIVFGHWSALGVYRGVNVMALDSGCVWGRKLTAFRLEDEQVFQVNAVEQAPSNPDD